MYHDQVLTPLKTLFNFNAINITIGLPFIRVSPDHGPNLEMYGKNKSDPSSIFVQWIFSIKLNENFPKKSLGQNFLIDKGIIKKICDAGNINEKDNVLEIGPGTGNLTEYIIQKIQKKFYIIEKDERLIKYLNEKFDKKLIIINEDILKYNLKLLSNKNLIVFGNLPYNISSQILINFINYSNSKFSYKKLVLMFQKEVADRILAEDNSKNYGRLSIFLLGN